MLINQLFVELRSTGQHGQEAFFLWWHFGHFRWK